MKCPLCQLEMRVVSHRNVIEHDNTPDEQTRLYTEYDLACMNRNCENYEKVLETERNELPIG